MIITRSPLRITLGGGGTDLASYYRSHGGFVISAAIDRYVYVNVIRPFTPGIFLKYSQIEHVDRPEQIRHPIVREVLQMEGDQVPQVEITTLADIPSGTGLGSSGSFSTALIKALRAHRHQLIHPQELAELACQVEIDRLKEPIGKQDQYIAAFGGISCFEFNKDETVTASQLKLSPETMLDLEDNLLLFFTGYSRSAGSILKDQDSRSQKNDEQMMSNLHYVKELGLLSKKVLEAGRADQFGEIMREHWEYKKRRSRGMSNPEIDSWYELGLRNGANGGKLVGAGGGGFLLFYATDRNRLRRAMRSAGLEEVRFRFDFEGTKVVMS